MFKCTFEDSLIGERIAFAYEGHEVPLVGLFTRHYRSRLRKSTGTSLYDLTQLLTSKK